MPELALSFRGGTTVRNVKGCFETASAIENAEHADAPEAAKGHIMVVWSTTTTMRMQMMKLIKRSPEEIMAITNAEGNWDDSDDEDTDVLRHSASKATLTSRTSSNVLSETSSAVDIWDM
jgi:hypothetical protein